MKPTLKLTTLLLGAALCGLGAFGQSEDRSAGAGHRGAREHGLPPALSTLDADQNGRLSEAEVAKAGEALRARDRDGDGQITADEARPHRRGPRADGVGKPRRMAREATEERDVKPGERRERRERELDAGEQPRRGERSEAGPGFRRQRRGEADGGVGPQAESRREGGVRRSAETLRSREGRGERVREYREGRLARREGGERGPGRALEARRGEGLRRQEARGDAAGVCPECGRPLPNRSEGRGGDAELPRGERARRGGPRGG